MTGSVRGALSNERPYRDRAPPITPRMQKARAPCPRGRLPMVGTARKARLCPPYNSLRAERAVACLLQ